MLTINSYNQYFEEIIQQENLVAPYDNPDYFNYAKLNHSRSNRWLKHGILLEETKDLMAAITSKHTWVLITEPWCGDAAHSVPFIELMAQLNPEKVELRIQLRDSGSEIDQYLTNGGKSIPKLIIRNNEGKDVAVWGPRPVDCQIVFNQLKEEGADFEKQKIELQNWYNADKGVSIQQEINELLKNI